MEFIIKWRTLSPLLIPLLIRALATLLARSSNCFQVISFLIFLLGFSSISALSPGYTLAFLVAASATLEIQPKTGFLAGLRVPPSLRFAEKQVMKALIASKMREK